MSPDLAPALDAFIKHTGATAAVVARVSSGEIVAAGDTGDKSVRWLYTRFLDSQEAVQNLAGSLEGEPAPKVWAQGAARAVFTLLNGYVLAVYYCLTPGAQSASREELLRDIARSEELGAELRQVVEPLLRTAR